MPTPYYLMSGQQKIGPFSEKNIVDGIRSGKISLFDMILHGQTHEWVMLMQHPDFCDVQSTSDEALQEDRDRDHHSIGLITEDLEERTQGISLEPEGSLSNLAPVFWYEKSAPQKRLKFLDVLSLIHTKKLSEHCFLAKDSNGPWKALIEWEDFSPEALATYKQASTEELPDIKIRRKAPRLECGQIFVALAKGKAFQIFCLDLSASGLAFVVRTPKANINDQVAIKFSDTLNNKDFDAKGVVVSVRNVKMPGSSGLYVRYGVRLTHLSQSGRKFLETNSAKASPEQV